MWLVLFSISSFINSWEGRSGDLYTDAGAYTDMFEDLNKSCDHLKNEFILKHFFRAKDPEKRTPVEIKGISVKENKEPDPESIWKENDNIKWCKI